jgi:hypothetical protein
MIESIPWAGKITKPGCYADVPMADYHGQPCDGPSISSSGLRTIFGKSLKHYFKDSPLNPERKADEKDRPYFSLGRAAHHLLFVGQEGFSKEFVCRPVKWSDWRTDAAKAWRAEQLIQGRTVITETELAHIVGMAKSLSQEPLIQQGILDGLVERTLAHRDPETGVWLLARPDCIPNHSGDAADLKTSAEVSREAIRRSLKDYAYHQQGALTGTAMKNVLDIEMTSFSLVYVESVEPYSVYVAAVPPEDIIRGRMCNEVATRMFADALETGQWFGPAGDQRDAEYIGLSEFERRRIDERLEELKGRYPYRGTPIGGVPDLHMELS